MWLAEPTDTKQAQLAAIDKFRGAFERIRPDFIVERTDSALLAGAIDGLVQVVPELARDQVTANAKKTLPNLPRGKDGLGFHDGG